MQNIPLPLVRSESEQEVEKDSILDDMIARSMVLRGTTAVHCCFCQAYSSVFDLMRTFGQKSVGEWPYKLPHLDWCPVARAIVLRKEDSDIESD